MKNPALQHAVRAARAIAAAVRHPPYVAPGHYYSPATGPADIERAVRSKRLPVGVDLRESEQRAFASALDLEALPENRWVENDMFGGFDAAVLRAVLRKLRPTHFYEVGAGYSTAIALDLAESELDDLRITSLEPYPERLLGRLREGDLERLTLIRAPAQSVDPAEIAGSVGAGDILFIDSTHVVKAGSDVVWLLLHTLPLLAPGVVVQVHDIHWPFEYSDEWLREGRDWTESYLLHAFLAHNTSWRIELFNAWLAQEHPELVPEAFRESNCGSIWLRRTA